MEKESAREKEEKQEKSKEDWLRKRGFKIEEVRFSEKDFPMQCGMCMDKDNNYQFYQQGWFIEGEFYCSKHKEEVLNLLEEVEVRKEKERRKQFLEEQKGQ